MDRMGLIVVAISVELHIEHLGFRIGRSAVSLMIPGWVSIMPFRGSSRHRALMFTSGWRSPRQSSPPLQRSSSFSASCYGRGPFVRVYA